MATSTKKRQGSGQRKSSEQQRSRPRNARDGLREVLMDKARTDVFPSTTMLDMIEELLTPESEMEYVEMLLERVAEDQYPSIPMLARIQKFA